MNIIQITPGAGKMYCGNCFRDNALVAALRKAGHDVTMIPLYLPLTLDEPDQSKGTPIFFNGVNVYLEQKSPFYRQAPRWLHRIIGSRNMLNWAAKKVGKTKAEEVGDLTISMLNGREGNQARELEELINWLKEQPKPDVICLSNSLLLGLAKCLQESIGVPIVCLLQNEAPYIDNMPEDLCEEVWELMTERGQYVDRFIAPSRYYADHMREKLKVPANRMEVVYNGINHDGYEASPVAPNPPTIGYFTRMCRDKGLDTLIDAFIKLKQANHIPQLKLKIGGGSGPGDEPFVERMRDRLHAKALLGEVEFHPNISRQEKQIFLKSLSVLSVPAQFGESFGFYVIEAMAAGVPVVQPHCASFPELIKLTGGGACYNHDGPESLAGAIEQLLHDPSKAKAIGLKAREVVREKFSIQHMAEQMADLYQELTLKTVED
ncbi:MAG: glycosyltransferase family 4 protein [Verrucomicrobiota bacterium]|nr:glycosyltransferase family 4 protein [Verrucomicrobiota bacterium]